MPPKSPDYARLDTKFSDYTTIILRGHLIVEQQLYDLLQAECENPEELSNARLSFPNLICVVRAILPRDRFPRWVWEGLQLMHSLRNKSAHRFPDNRALADLESLFRIIEPFQDEIPEFGRWMWQPHLPENPARAIVYTLTTALTAPAGHPWLLARTVEPG